VSRPRQTRLVDPTLALSVGAALLALSVFLPYWEIRVEAPKPSDGARVVGYLDHLEGSLDSVLPGLEARAEVHQHHLSRPRRLLVLVTLLGLCALVASAASVRNGGAALLSLPGLLFPIVFLLDLARWLGPGLDALPAAGSPSTDGIGFLLGRATLGEAVIELWPRAGLFAYLAALVAVAGGLWLHRRACRPAERASPRRARPDDRPAGRS
jgi:hypothetical protein